jgi:hypothetical protein
VDELVAFWVGHDPFEPRLHGFQETSAQSAALFFVPVRGAPDVILDLGPEKELHLD